MPPRHTGLTALVAWMVTHPVAANLMMLVMLLGGFLSYSLTTKDVFPEFDPDMITVSMSYPGAGPEEVEQGILLPIETAVRDVDGLHRITSRASEGSGSLSAEIIDPDDLMRVMQEVKTAVDRIRIFPVGAEDLRIAVNSRRRNVLDLALYGSADEFTLRQAASRVQSALERDPGIGFVELAGAKRYEIHIEVPQENLRRYGLTLRQVAEKVRMVAVEVGGGRVETARGEILLRMSERRDGAEAFGTIPILTEENGGTVFLRDIASVTEGFEDANNEVFYEGKRAVMFDVGRVGKQTPIGVSEAAKARLEELNRSLPGDLSLAVIRDRSEIFKQRAHMLLSDGVSGFLLVVGFLALFLDVRLAFWVGMGIPVSFLGAFLLLPMADFTVNMVSMFAFLIGIGIVVDDAIVFGENIYRYRQQGCSPKEAAVLGAGELALPIIVSAATNMVAFVPLLFVPGAMGKTFQVIPIVVISVFFISLIESMLVLPSHLTFKKADVEARGVLGTLIGMQKSFNRGFDRFVEERYGALLKGILAHRYLASASFLSIMAVMAGYVASGRMGMQLFPRVEADFAFAEATLPVGAPESEIRRVREILTASGRETAEENGGRSLYTGILATVKENRVEIRVQLTDPDVRPIHTKEFTDVWRRKTGEIPGLETLSFQSDRGGPGSGAALTVELSHDDVNVLEEAGRRLAAALAEFPETKDIDDGSASGKRQYDFVMKPLGYALGMTTSDVARQIRDSFYGSEAFKQQRGRDEVRVLARLPEKERSSEYRLRRLMLRTPAGGEVPLSDVAEAREGRAYTAVNRRDGRRIAAVKADVVPPSQAGRIVRALQEEILPELQGRYPGLSYAFEGRQAELRDSTHSLFIGLIGVVFVIYALLAAMFNSYSQPFMILVAIPFSAAGAVIGHMIMGYSLSVMSLFGIMALAGVVVNQSMILVEFANRKRESYEDGAEMIVASCVQRFRPIVLTTVTTFVGLAPMIFETSRQAKFLVPMAISLGFGSLFATAVTLTLVPALFMAIEDAKGRGRRSGGDERRTSES